MIIDVIKGHHAVATAEKVCSLARFQWKTKQKVLKISGKYSKTQVKQA